jgi:hypothetical protein
MTAWFPDLICNFYCLKIQKNVNNSATVEAIERINDRFGILRFLEKFDLILKQSNFT